MKQRILFLLFLLSACSSLPADVLPPKKMQAVLWDVMRADGLVSEYQEHDSLKNIARHRTGYYKEVFRLQGITEAQFKRSLKYYENHPDLFKTVLDSMQAVAERIQKNSDTGRKAFPPPPPIDSSRMTKARDSSKTRQQKNSTRHKNLPVM